MFNRWHSNIFPKSVLRDIAERALIAFEQSRIRIKTLNTMEEQVIENNTKLLQLFEKIKYMVAVSHKYQRKDIHYGGSPFVKLRRVTLSSFVMCDIIRLTVADAGSSWKERSSLHHMSSA